ncbi:MAG: hypothetical protein OER90_16500 [Gemmatimonadota bacterium]|nr:hypothetical protein [Gemmatimonadota bacterium]
MRWVLALMCLALVAPNAAAQRHPEARRARVAYDDLDLRQAIVLARRALQFDLSRDDRIATLEILAFSYAALDSTNAAVEAFKELIFIDPNREPDVDVVSPRITSLYASALGQVLVVRNVRMDSASFVAGQGYAALRFEVSRGARAMTSVFGPGGEMVIDTQLVSGPTRVDWTALDADGSPVPPGEYRVVVTAVEGRNEFAVPITVEVSHGRLDTVPHLRSLPGYVEQPEVVSPPRNWKPLGYAVLFAGLAAGATLALENTDVGGGTHAELGGASVLTLGVGLALSLKRPDPRPVEANIQYNKLLREQLTARNTEIAFENERRRQQVRLSISQMETP